MRALNLLIISVLFVSCSPVFEDDFESIELISSKGEKLYINTISWGVTGDYQATVISHEKNKLKKRAKDSSEVTFRYSPFIYSFNNDSLNLYFNEEITYKVKEHFNTITISYIALDRITFEKLTDRARRNDNYYLVPKYEEKTYPSDMPRPPE